MAKYHYLVVGAGLFGSVFAQQMAEHGKRCLVLDRRGHVAGNIHCDIIEDIQVHRYGPHVFHTRDSAVWGYVNRFARWNNYVHTPVALGPAGVFHLPLNMNTFAHLWGVCTPTEAREELQRQIALENIGEPRNLEEQILKQAGRDVYEKTLKGYIEKQWGCACSELPVNAIQIPQPRFVYDDRKFTDPYQGIPVEGYDVLIKRMLAACDVMLNTEYFVFQRANQGIADRTIFTGLIDEYFHYKQGALEYQTFSYQTEVLDTPNWQGTAVVEHVDSGLPYTRTIEHKHFQFGQQPKTVVTTEYPVKWNSGLEPYLPLETEKNKRIYSAYRALSVTQPDVLFCGRLGTFHHYTMAETVRAALDLAKQELKR